MNRKERATRASIREHARLAEAILPPMPSDMSKTSKRLYFESYRSRLFEACRTSKHRLCPKTAEHGPEHLYCSCPCHQPGLTSYQRRQKLLALKASERKHTRTPRDPNAPRAAVGTRGQQKVFRYLQAPKDPVPAGIMRIVHETVSTIKRGTVAEIAALAIQNGLTKVTGQDPIVQTSVMLHRLLKAGVVEVVA